MRIFCLVVLLQAVATVPRRTQPNSNRTALTIVYGTIAKEPFTFRDSIFITEDEAHPHTKIQTGKQIQDGGKRIGSTEEPAFKPTVPAVENTFRRTNRTRNNENHSVFDFYDVSRSTNRSSSFETPTILNTLRSTNKTSKYQVTDEPLPVVNPARSNTSKMGSEGEDVFQAQRSNQNILDDNFDMTSTTDSAIIINETREIQSMLDSEQEPSAPQQKTNNGESVISDEVPSTAAIESFHIPVNDSMPEVENVEMVTENVDIPVTVNGDNFVTENVNFFGLANNEISKIRDGDISVAENIKMSQLENIDTPEAQSVARFDSLNNENPENKHTGISDDLKSYSEVTEELTTTETLTTPDIIVDSAQRRMPRLNHDSHLKPRMVEFRKCCPDKHVVHLEKSERPSCMILHGPDFGQLVPPVEPTAQVSLEPVFGKLPQCNNASLKILKEGFQFEVMETGKLKLNTSFKAGVLPDEYCIDLSIENGLSIKTIAMVCVDFDDICKDSSCVNACCDRDEFCGLPSGDRFSGSIARNTALDCNSTQRNISIKDHMMYYHGDHGSPLLSNEYCIHTKGLLVDDTVEASVCNVRSVNNHQKFMTRLLTVFLLISVLSLFVSLVLHLAVPELRASMFTWMKISHLLSMQIWYIVLFVILSCSTDLVINHSLTCKILGFLLQYFMMSSFFWVNVMSLDIWRTFRHMRGYGNMVARSLTKRRRYLYYSLYAWGCPLLVSAFTMAVQFLPSAFTQYIYTPGIGEESCFLKTDLGKFFYFFLPISVLMALNIIFFVLASYSLAFGVWAPAANDRIKRRTTQRFMIVVELFFIMGLNWIGDIVTWAVSWGYGTRAYQAAIFFDIVNALQGFIIFLIVVMKSRIIRSIKRFFLGLPIPPSVQTSLKRLAERRQTGGAGSATTPTTLSSGKPVSDVLSRRGRPVRGVFNLATSTNEDKPDSLHKEQETSDKVAGNIGLTSFLNNLKPNNIENNSGIRQRQ